MSITLLITINHFRITQEIYTTIQRGLDIYISGETQVITPRWRLYFFFLSAFCIWKLLVRLTGTLCVCVWVFCVYVCVCVYVLGFQGFLNFVLCKMLLYFTRVELYVHAWRSSKTFQLIKKKKKGRKTVNLEMLDIYLSHSGVNPSLLQCNKVVLDYGICISKFNWYRLCVDLKGSEKWHNWMEVTQ